MWLALLLALALATAVFLYLVSTRYFTERAFLRAYHSAMFRSGSHPDALRAALRTFETRAPFNVLTQAELDHACLALAALFDAHAVARIVRLLDRTRDARLLANEQFLRGVVYTHAGLWH